MHHLCCKCHFLHIIVLLNCIFFRPASLSGDDNSHSSAGYNNNRLIGGKSDGEGNKSSKIEREINSTSLLQKQGKWLLPFPRWFSPTFLFLLGKKK